VKLDRSTLQAWALASEVGCSIAIFLVGCIVGGAFLDRYLHSSPIFLLIGIFMGLALAGYNLYRLTLFRTSREIRRSRHRRSNDSDQE